MKFKVGDKVRCIDPNQVEKLVVADVTYTVKRIETGFTKELLHLEGIIGGHYAYRFELAPEFKPGDRVAVAFEDVITEVIEGIAYFSNRSSAAPVTVLKKLTNPIPTTNGAVIRLNWVMADIFENIGSQWFKTGTDKMYTPGQVQGMADKYGFIVLYEGS